MRPATSSVSTSACRTRAVTPAAHLPLLAVDYFDGRSARARPVTLGCRGGTLHIDGEGLALRVPLSAVQWPERTRHGARVAHLPDGASLHGADPSAWDAFVRACGQGDSAVVRLQQSWRWVGASMAALVLVLAGLYHWGVPWAARAVVAATPLSVDLALGEAALASLDAQMLQPSRLNPARQQRLRAAFAQALAAQPAGSVPAHHIEFRRSRLGPNAFALPGGTIIVTDELVLLLDAPPGGDTLVGSPDHTLIGVLAHELGHVRQRYGLRMVVQVAAVGVLASAVLGDFSTLLAGAPVLLGQAGYSRDAEREADAEAVQVLRAAGISPRVMVAFFDQLAAADARAASAPAGTAPAEAREAGWLGIAIASHPADAERVRYFNDAAGPR